MVGSTIDLFTPAYHKNTNNALYIDPMSLGNRNFHLHYYLIGSLTNTMSVSVKYHFVAHGSIS